MARSGVTGVGRGGRDNGAATVEFALIASLVLFPLLVGMLQYSLYFWSLQSGSHAAREAARQAAVGSLTCTQFRDLVSANAQGETASSVVAARTFYADTTMATSGPAVVGGVVKVNVTFDSIDLNFPALPFVPDGRVSEQGVARVENVTPNSVACS
ncbi:MAG: pilus assembly protein [Nocardioidaceae bacterium]|nr:pilus assembly protein [Nocardioidaceae bacterium]